MKTIGIVVVAALAARLRQFRCGDDGNSAANQFGRQRRQSIVSIIGPAIFDRHVLDPRQSPPPSSLDGMRAVESHRLSR